MRRLMLGVLLMRAAFVLPALLIATWVVPVVAQPPLTIFDLAIPDQVAGLPHGQPHDYEKTNPGLGYSIKFMQPGWAIDVYIYTLNLKSISDDPMSEVVKQQLAQAKSDVLKMEKRGEYANVVVKDDYIVNDAVGRTRFVCSALTFDQKKQSGFSVDSYICLTSSKNKFFKIRMTTRQNAASSADVRRFVEGWTTVLWS